MRKEFKEDSSQKPPIRRRIGDLCLCKEEPDPVRKKQLKQLAEQVYETGSPDDYQKLLRLIRDIEVPAADAKVLYEELVRMRLSHLMYSAREFDPTRYPRYPLNKSGRQVPQRLRLDELEKLVDED